MIRIMPKEQNCYEEIMNNKRIVVIYGSGSVAQAAFPFLNKMFDIAYVCDTYADGAKKLGDHIAVKPEELEKVNLPMNIVVCIKRVNARKEVFELLEKAKLDAYVFDYFNNVSFDTFAFEEKVVERRQLKWVNIVDYSNGWIINKFSEKLRENLEKRGIKATIGRCVELEADINHHLIYDSYESLYDCRDTFMITHIDSLKKIEKIKHNLKIARMGMCMSKDTMNMLVSNGVPREKLCYVNPAQDGVIAPKKYVLGMTYKGHDDNRKKLSIIVDICRHISPEYFEFKIMGQGWDEIVFEMEKLGFKVTYYSDFEYDTYVKLMPTLDYYLYWGFDEGQMGVLDALRAGVGTIITPQGYHLDLKNGITYSCRTKHDFIDVLVKLENERKARVNAVSSWTWEAYTDKHIDIWNYLLGNTEHLYDHQHEYEDGINSVLMLDR